MSVETIPTFSQKSLHDTEEDCILALFQAKWPNGFVCPGCENRHAYLISTRRLPLYECTLCSKQTSLIAGTIMEGSKTTLYRWFQAIQLVTQPRSINALQLSKLIGVTYKTAWLIYHKIRYAMTHSESREILNGLVRIESTTIYRRALPTFGFQHQEQPLIIGAEINDHGEIAHIKMEHPKEFTKNNHYGFVNTLPFIQRNVNCQAEVLAPKHHLRSSINRNKALIQKSREVNNWLTRTFRGIGPKHLQGYLDQFCFQSNNHLSLIFDILLKECAVTPAMTYTVLVSGTSIRSNRKNYFTPSKIAS